MTLSDPFRFWAIKPDGEKAFLAFEHLRAYYDGCMVQFARIDNLWREASANEPDLDDVAAIGEKVRAMQQVVRDIHYLLISMQAVWRTLQTLSSPALYPSFASLGSIRDKWELFFEQFRDARNTLEHYEDQILGADTRSNSPGYGLSLSPDGGFSLGIRDPVSINQETQDQLTEFWTEFNVALDGIVGPEIWPGSSNWPPAAT